MFRTRPRFLRIHAWQVLQTHQILPPDSMLTDFDFPCGLWDRPDTGSRAGARGALRISRIWHILKILMPTRAIPQNIQILDILDILEWSGRVGRAAGAALAPLGRQNMAESTGF